MTSHSPAVPRATYRVQLHAGFTFDDATAIVGYLRDLGVSHLYVSPVLQAMPGSTHGYDVVDHSRVSEELGGEDGFGRLTDALEEAGMGLVLDIVPNHMAIGGAQNHWWADVLEHGPASRYAGYFDVDWEPPESRLHNVILLPVLPDHYGRVLEAGALRLTRRGGRLEVEHAGRAFPIDPRTSCGIVADAATRASSDELAFIATALDEMPPSTSADPELVARRQRDADVLGARLEELAGDPAIAGALDDAVARVNCDIEALDALLERQNYRLALWRAAARDLGYRRFFDIDELIGLRMEDERVFGETHALPLRWVAEGRVAGIRVDHPDGLRDPAGYFRRLRAGAPSAWIVAEKILEADESIPPDWPIDGTTGYRFANLATGMLVDTDGEAPMNEAWAERADAGPDWPDVMAQARRDALSTVLGSDVNRLADLFLAICEENRRYRDFTRHELDHAIREVAAALPVYRTYVRAGDHHLSEPDRALIGEAVGVAAERRPDLDPELFEFLGRILRLEVPGTLPGELAMRFQQLTPAAMAKGVEDTAFYRYHRLVALNEVGGDPGRFGVASDRLHAALSADAEGWPHTMLSLSTHDTKRSADVRARLALLSEDPAGWRVAAGRLADALEPHRTGPEHPTDADIYLLLQTLVGTWPIDVERVTAYLGKATREAKLRTSWTAPDVAYDEALDRLARGAMGDATFCAELRSFVAPLVEPGRRAALAQLAVQLTAPGVPDIYQGSELWDLALVDPDNRRPVNYRERRGMLERARSIDAASAWQERDTGMAKLWLTHRALDLRRRRPEPFVAGACRPLVCTGPAAGAIVAFARGDDVVTVVPRRIRRLERDGTAGTAVRLPAGTWRGLDGASHTGEMAVGALLAAFPVAILERTP